MHITKITEGQETPTLPATRINADMLQREFDYYIAQKLLKSLLDAGLISEDEFDKITAINRQFFSPYLARIMPK